MAYRRSITTRLKHIYEHHQQHRIASPFASVHQTDNDDRKAGATPSPRYPQIHHFPQHRRYGGGGFSHNQFGHALNTLFQNRRFSPNFSNSMVYGSFLGAARNMSTGVGEGAERIEYISDVAGVLAEKAAESAPAVSEVAVAAADSYLPVAALQYLIDYVHTFTGFEWWASIVVTTILIRLSTFPFMINQLKATSKFTLLRPRLEEIKDEMQNKGMSPPAVAEGQQRMQALFKEYGVTPFTPLKGLLIQGPVFVSFFLAITNMVEKVPSFKQGGAFWFTDLTTPDTLYIFPVLTALTFWITVECNAQEGLEGNPSAGTIKNVSRIFAVLTVPLTAGFQKAIFCYWITSNLFSLMYGLVIRKHAVKRFLGIPIIPVAPPSTEVKPGLPFFESLKKFAAAQQYAHQHAISSPAEETKPSGRVSSSSVLNQRIKSLEKDVKGRKKGKKR